MNEEINLVGGSFSGQTTVHPLGLAAVIILGLCVLFLKRRWAIIPFLLIACFVPTAQRVVISGFDFNFLRIITLFGILRLIIHGEYRDFVWKQLDLVIVFWVISSMFFYTIHYGSTSALVNRLGFAFDTFGMYFFFRCMIKNWKDVDRIIFGVILISIPISIFFVFENMTGRNVFSFLGGVPPFTAVRNGRLRCQGAYSHAILAGCFWASLIPLIAAYWWKSKKDKTWAVLGVSASLIIVFCCASSTPVMGVIAAVAGGTMFFFRKFLQLIRWTALFALIALHMVMNAPVWHLISRISAVGGSTGYHRYKLIDETISNFGDWWFSGCSGYTVASWGVWAGDVTNQYVLEGIRGGIVTLLIFIVIIVIAFREVGRRLKLHKYQPYRLTLSWAIGVSFFVHCINFIGVSYFGQIHVLWYLVLAMIGSIAIHPPDKQIQPLPPSSHFRSNT